MSEDAAHPAVTQPHVHYRPTTRTGRYYTLGAPPEAARRVWFVLHGYAQLAARMLRHFAGGIPEDTMVVAPEGLSRFYLEMPRADGGHMARVGAAWLTREDREHEIEDGMAWLDGVHDDVVQAIAAASGQLPDVAVLAFSQGVATALRWIVRGFERRDTASRTAPLIAPRQFVVWAGGLAQDIPADAVRRALSAVDVVFVTGEHDPFATPAVREKMAGEVQALGITPRTIVFDGTHQLHAGVLATLLHEFSRP